VKIRNPESEIRSPQIAFTLLEVMVATAIFFMAVFAILGLVAGALRNARALQQIDADAGMLAAELNLTNRLKEGVESGDFGNLYPGYTWTRDTYLWPVMPTNGLFQVDFTVSRQVGKQPVETHMSILCFAPDSQVSGGFRR